MSPARPNPPKAPKASKPPKPWSRAEAGRHVSADERFTLESDGTGRWFVTDDQSLDELGLARTTGPFPTLDAAKAGADAARKAPAAESPLAARLAAAKDRPPAPTSLAKANRRPSPARSHDAAPELDAAPEPPQEPAPAPRTWLDDLADSDPAAAKRARSLIRALEREGIADGDGLVRRDLLGDRPAIATRLLARDVLAALAGLQEPSAAALAEAVAGVLAGSPKRAGLPGWELRERDAPGGRDRPIRLTAADLLAAAEGAGET